MKTITNPCPRCSAPVEYEPCADLPGVVPICEACEPLAAAEWDAKEKHRKWQAMLENMPTNYRKAIPSKIPPQLDGVMGWDRFAFPHGLGVIGTSGMGKSCAVACLVAWLKMPFRWMSGTEIRELSIQAAKSDDAMTGAKRRWNDAMHATPLLVIDDIAQAKFTESWASALYDLLEARTGNHLPTIWTMQITGAELRAKIIAQNGGDKAQAQAIIRRMTTGMKHVVAHESKIRI
jgi:hypothetical protein